MRATVIAATIAAALSAVPIGAGATSAYAIAGAQILAGPGNDYPIVGRLQSGAVVDVNGCLRDYSWCDVSFGPNRGWVHGRGLSSPYQYGAAPIVQYGPQHGLPTITFSLGDYWDHHYRSRPFYGERDHWEQRWRDDAGGRHEGGRGDVGEHRRNESGGDAGRVSREAAAGGG